ncbi:hypothetical protein BDP81DRAFT_165336 [Colletotrichum phormii]|uniref:Uncharacterized protein n=1 Tax=Colletotrichum phormii TaxID=359342 RepID=A0AAJ0A100_9PEZI|nr:uncharacterized protein BDP81DRAFT_165336 [Colletotrichum phormii]KAK1640563.1 hypothetical protein BDP81DRAFT_165336 [Colletotrichum phormii]
MPASPVKIDKPELTNTHRPNRPPSSKNVSAYGPCRRRRANISRVLCRPTLAAFSLRFCSTALMLQAMLDEELPQIQIQMSMGNISPGFRREKDNGSNSLSLFKGRNSHKGVPTFCFASASSHIHLSLEIPIRRITSRTRSDGPFLLSVQTKQWVSRTLEWGDGRHAQTVYFRLAARLWM